MRYSDTDTFKRLRSLGINVLLAVMVMAGVALSGNVVAHAEGDVENSLGELADECEIVDELLNETGKSGLLSVEALSESDQEEESVKWNDNYSKKELMYMSAIIYCEAGSLSHDAKVGVANVILNRANNNDDWAHVSTIKQVIYDKKWGVQFSPAYSGSSNSMKNAVSIYKNMSDYEGTWRYTAMQQSIEAAKAAFCGERAVPDTYMYFNGNESSSKAKCKANKKTYIVIEGHIYY